MERGEEDLRIFGPSYWEEVDWPCTHVLEIESSSHWKRGRAKEQKPHEIATTFQAL